MKESTISKLVILICILCLILGFFKIDKDEPYNNVEGKKATKSKTLMNNVNKIAVIEMEGAIASSYESNFFSRESNAPNLLKSLIAAKDDSEVKGIIIKINSPGGTVAMSQNIYNQIIKIRKDKPVIVMLDDIAASGGYYIASAADRIIAQEGTLTGSIGVIFSYMDFHNLLTNKLSVNPIVIKSGKYKDIASGMREITDEEKELMQEIINDSYEQFVNAIRVGRIERNDKYSVEKTDLTSENLKNYADGRVFTGRQAKAIGFVDTLGDIDTAKAAIEKMAQEKFNNKLNAKLVNYNKKSAFSEYFSGLAEYNTQAKLQLTDFIPTSMILSRKPLYLWE